MKDIIVTIDGTVNANAAFSSTIQCADKSVNYPEKRSVCCLHLKSALYGEVIKFNVTKGKDTLKVSDLPDTWKVVRQVIKPSKKLFSRGDQLDICMDIYIRDPAKRMQLSVPMWVSAILLLISPLVGVFQHQVYVKMFAILLQFMSFQFLAVTTRTGHREPSGTIPPIFKFYEFTMLLTLFSLVSTLLIWSASRAYHLLPPPHNMLLVAKAINTKLICCDQNGVHQEHALMNDQSTKPSDNQADWLQVFTAVNSVMSVLVVVMYVIGIICIMA